jgi:23S rRNA pseudouridine2457 synthase
VLVLFNKPFNVLCQFSAESDKTTLKDFIALPGVYAAGRLDYDSEGLLLLTDDGKLQHRISHPRHKLAKTYWVQVEGDLSDTALQQLRAGIVLNDGLTQPAQAERITAPAIWPRDPPIRVRKTVPDSWLQLTIHEGRNRQVRRMTAAVGFPTLRLIRAQIGPWQLEGLQPGEHRVIKNPQLPTLTGG